MRERRAKINPGEDERKGGKRERGGRRSSGLRVKNVLVCQHGLDVSGDKDGNSS